MKIVSGETKFVNVSFVDEPELEDGFLRLDLIQTNPPKRSRGIGGALLAAVIGWGRDRGVARLTGDFKPDPFSKSADVERFYNHRGITITEDGNLEGRL